MSNCPELEEVHIVAYGLISLIDDAMHKLQGIFAFGNNYSNRVTLQAEEDWYALAYSTLLESLAMDVASLTENGRHGNDCNCSFKELKLVLESSEFSGTRYREAIDELSAFIDKYQKVLPDNLRNKVLAHRDLNELFHGKGYDLNLIETTRFLIEGYLVTSKALAAAVGAESTLPDLEAIKKKYEESLELPLRTSKGVEKMSKED